MQMFIFQALDIILAWYFGYFTNNLNILFTFQRWKSSFTINMFGIDGSYVEAVRYDKPLPGLEDREGERRLNR